MCLVETQSGENGPVCIFETLAEDSFTFAMIKPLISEETEAAMIEQLRSILNDEESG